jgi:DNA repair protein SbcC/Rad50
MLPRRLTLKGFTSYTNELNLDLAEVPAGSLVAIVGPNGAGKSTLLEALGPAALYREFPSYPGPAMDCCPGRPGTLDLTFEHADHLWRVLLQVDPLYSNGRGSQDAFLWRDGEPMNNGKARTFKEQVAKHLPPKDLLLASAFSSQDGGAGFLELDQVGRRELFATLLGLDGLQLMASRAGDHRKRLDAVSAELDRAAAALADHRTRHQQLTDRHQVAGEIEAQAAAEWTRNKEIADRLAGKSAAAAAISGRLEQARAAAQDTNRRAEESTSAAYTQLRRIAARQTADQLIIAAASELEGDAARRVELLAEDAELRQQQRTITQATKAAEAERSRLTREEDQVRARLGVLRARQATIDQATKQLPELEATVQQLEVDRLDLSRARQAHTTRSTAYRAAAGAAAVVVQRAEQALRSAELAAGRAQDLAEALDSAPCKGGTVLLGEPSADSSVDCSTCSYLQEAVRSRDSLGSLDSQVEAARAELEAAATAKEAQAEEAAAVSTLAAEVYDLEDRVARARPSEARLQELRAAVQHDDAQELYRVDQRVDQVVDELEQLGDRARARAVDREATEATWLALQPRLQEFAALDGQLEQLAAARGRVEELTVGEAEARAATERAAAAKVDVPPAPIEQIKIAGRAAAAATEAAGFAEDARTTLEQQRDKLAQLAGALAELGDPEAKGAELAARAARAGARRRGFALVERAFGREGIQALEIDAAGPLVSAYANRLLSACTEGRFTTSLSTVQAQSGRKKAREAFTLQVLDGQAPGDGERSVDRTSGGERVLVDEALKLAIAIFNHARAGTPIRTLWRDECDGALSPENAARYPGLLREAMEIGEFDLCLFISHRPDVWQQADWIVQLQAGGGGELVRL